MNIISSTQKKTLEASNSISNCEIKLQNKEIKDYKIKDCFFITPAANEKKLRSIYTKAKNTINENRKIQSINSAKDIMSAKIKRMKNNNKGDKVIGYMNSSMSNLSLKSDIKCQKRINNSKANINTNSHIFSNRTKMRQAKPRSPIKDKVNRDYSMNHNIGNDNRKSNKNCNNSLMKRKKYAETIKKTLNKGSTSNSELNSFEESMIMNISIMRRSSCGSMSQYSLKRRMRSLSKERNKQKQLHDNIVDFKETNKKLDQIASGVHGSNSNSNVNITSIKVTPKRIDEYRNLKRLIILKSINI